MRYILTLLCVLCTLNLTAGAVPPPQNMDSLTYWQFVGQQTDNKLQRAVLRILVFNDEGKGTGWGTGFFVGKDIIATAAHVVEGVGHTFKLQSSLDGIKQLGIAEIITIDKERDLALLRLTSSGMIKAQQVSLKLNTNKPEYGTTLYSFGYGRYPMQADGFNRRPGGIQIGARGIAYNSYNSLQDLLIMHTAQIFGGHSGGPLFNEQGEVVGVNVSTHSGQSLGIDEHNGYSNDKFVIHGAETAANLLKLLNTIK